MSAPARRLPWRSIAGVLVIALVIGWWLVSRIGDQGGQDGARGPSTSSSQTTRRGTSQGTPRGDQGSQPQGGQQSRGSKGADPGSGLPVVKAAQLPAEARQTITLIERGGPFPYPKDGSSFGNFEGALPNRPRGYYKEYTVPTPGERDRGARRIVTGDNDRELFWTADHYAHFAKVDR